MSDNSNGLADIIAGIAVAQGVLLKMLLLSGVVTAEQATAHFQEEMDRLTSKNASDEMKLATERLLQFSSGLVKQPASR